MKIKLCFILLVSALLAGCASGPLLTTPAQVAASTRITDDPYTRVVSATGPSVPYGKYHLGFYTLVARRNGSDKKAELLVQEWRPSGDGWMFLESAHDISGQALPVRVVAHEVEEGASIHELVAVEFPKGYLQKHFTSGLNIRIDGQRDSLTVIVPPTYLQGFFVAVGASPAMR